MWSSSRVKEQQKAHRGMGPWWLNTQHRASVSSGGGTLLLSSWYIPERHGFLYPNTSWHWRLHRSQSSGERPGTCTRPGAAHHHGSRQRPRGASLSESSDMSWTSQMGLGVRGLRFKSILHRKKNLFQMLGLKLWNNTGSVLLSVGVVQTHLCFKWESKKIKI